tara:strand:- start:897 stop:1130 length:234 start_codon:yes stop_codon:yes gene_type:complete
MSIIEYLIFVFLILNIIILYLPRGINRLSNKLFSKSPSKIAWLIIWVILATVYFTLLNEVYFYLKGQINDSIILTHV